MPFQRLSGWLNYYITRWRQEVSQFGDQTCWWQDVVEKARTQQSGPPGLWLSSPREQERHNADGHKSEGQYVAVLFGLKLHLTHKPFQIKWEVYFFKEVFARLYSLHQYVSCMYMCIYVYLLCDYTTFDAAWSFVDGLLICTSHIIIKGITIWGVRWPDITSDVVTEIFIQPTLGPPACVEWCKVLLQVIQQPPSWSRVALLPSNTWYRPPCWAWSNVRRWMEAESPSLVTTPHTMMWTGSLIFNNMNINLSSDWYPNTLKYLHWSFWCECQTVQHTISKFLKEGITLRHCFLYSLLYSSLLYKKCMHKIDNLKWRQQFTHRTQCMYLYISQRLINH